MKYATFNRNGLKAIVVTLAFLFVGLNGQAQNSKSDIKEWFKSKGVEYLARFAHPNPSNSYVSHNIILESDSNITVEIIYNGIFNEYSCWYDISISTSKDNTPYFSNVVSTKEGCMWANCFQNWEPDDYPLNYNNNYVSLYGETSFYDLTNSKKAAFALTYEFLNSK